MTKNNESRFINNLRSTEALPKEDNKIVLEVRKPLNDETNKPSNKNYFREAANGSQKQLLGYIFNNGAGGGSLYQKDVGNHELYTPENIKKRQGLKTDIAVKDSIYRFTNLFEKDENNEISKGAYSKVHRKICKHILPDISTKQWQKNLR